VPQVLRKSLEMHCTVFGVNAKNQNLLSIPCSSGRETLCNWKWNSDFGVNGFKLREKI
jgi:hypothetical protein